MGIMGRMERRKQQDQLSVSTRQACGVVCWPGGTQSSLDARWMAKRSSCSCMASAAAVLDAGAGVAVGAGRRAGPAVVVAGAAARARHAVAPLVLHPPGTYGMLVDRHGGGLAEIRRRLVPRRARAHGPTAPGAGVGREEREREAPTAARQGGGGGGGGGSEEEGDGDGDEGLYSGHGGGRWVDVWCSREMPVVNGGGQDTEGRDRACYEIFRACGLVAIMGLLGWVCQNLAVLKLKSESMHVFGLHPCQKLYA
jgi:hypothetical protein